MPIPWNEIWQVMLALAAGIVTLTAAGSAVVKLFNPYKKLVARLDESQRAVAALREEVQAYHIKYMELFKRDYERFGRNDEKDNVLFKSVFALLEHARTNNSTGLMDAASKEMQEYLIERK